MESINEWMNITDGCVAAILVLGLLGGMRRGLSGELLRIATILLALLVGWKFSGAGATWLAGHSTWSAEELKPLSFFGLILATYIVLGIVRIAMRLFLDFSFKGKLETLGGATVGLFRAAVFCAVVLLGASLIPSESVRAAVGASVTGNWVLTHVRPLYDDLIEKNPEFKLPELRREETPSLDTPAWEQYLGPLIEPESDDDGE